MALVAGASTAVVAAGASTAVVAEVSMAVAVADVGEAGVAGRIRVSGSFSLCPHQDGGCTSNA
jgi:hypothetical protein